MGGADPDAMALQDLVLQDTGIRFRYFGIGQDTETRIDAIDRSLTGGDPRHMLLARPDLFLGRGRNASAMASGCKANDRSDRKPVAAILKIGGVHNKIV